MELIRLNNGTKIPSVGFGVYQIPKKETEQCVLNALMIGYRHIDTARDYGNEREVGSAILKSGIPRNKIFLTTKIAGAYSYQKACQSIDEALEKLQTDYIDLLLFHWPSGNINETYRAMEDYYKQGKLKAIGVSNFFGDNFNKIIQKCTVIPMINQVEAHIFHQRKELQKEMEQYSILLEAWSPLACGKNNIFHNTTLERIAQVHHKSIAQVALKFLNQKGIIIIPKSIHIERMKENLDILNFRLSDNEMKEIELLDKNQSLFGWYE